EELCTRELTPAELGVVYPSRCDNRSATGDRAGAIDVGIQGLARLGVRLPPNPSALKPLPLLFANQRKLAKLTHEQHVKRPAASDERALAALRVLSTMTLPVFLSQRTNLYVLLVETAIELILKYGHVQQTSGFLGTHAAVLLGGFGKHEAARVVYEACLALERGRPAPALYGRTSLVLFYMLHGWFAPWQESADELSHGIERSIEAGDPLFAALCASGAVTMQAMCGVPFDRLGSCLENWRTVMNIDRALAGSSLNVANLAGKFARGEAIEAADLEPITKFPVAAGPMRNNPMVNFGLALAVVGHEAQVRSWLDDIRADFPKVNFSQPQVANLWLLDGLFAAKDARLGQTKRLGVAKAIVTKLRRIVQKTRSTNLDPIITLLEAEILRATGDLERAAGFYVRAASEARGRNLHHLVAFGMEQRGEMLEELGAQDEAALFFREAALAYQRWGHVTKVRQLESARPELKAMELATYGTLAGSVREQSALSGSRTAATRTVMQATRGQSRATLQATVSRTLNEALDLTTVLKVSQEISTQLSGSGVVRAVLSGIAQNAGAERVLFVLRAENGVETVYAEFRDGDYRELGVPLGDYDDAPHSLIRVLRRTQKPVVIADGSSDGGHASDPFIVQNRCLSLAGIPVVRNNVVTGYLVLENRLVAGAFTPQLVDLTRALASQAAISLDNASLYENLELRVRERTVELRARNAELRMVLDNVAQGLVTVDREGRLSSERSRIFEHWFAGGLPDTVHTLFAPDPKSAALFELGWEQLIEGVLPLELCIEQMPRRLHLEKRSFELHWRPIAGEGEQLRRVLLVMSDVTEVRLRQRSEHEQRQLMALVERLAHDRGGVLEFMRESRALVHEVQHGHSAPEVEKRLVHTLKGNCALFGVSVLSALCHEIENGLELDRRSVSEDERIRLRDAWSELEKRLTPFLDMNTSTLLVVRRDYDSALKQLQRENHPLGHDLELWAFEPLDLRFQRIGEQARRLVQRLAKGDLEIQNEHGGFRIPPEPWAPFWAAFAHAVRNAVDHGIESPEERRLAGKGAPTLTLRAYQRGTSFVFELSDDGRGIAWDKIRSKALAAGLCADTREDLVAALFVAGISSKECADELSGRGIGMPALLEACRAMGGEISVESSSGQGTTWRFEFPGELARPALERRASVRPSVAPAN
ncbi:MAG TPA: ATP-binding protein, partial [Polyangiaceae bacterium]|nr:ATP-binding protein [Polyangiaceae bacterium]